MSQAAAAADKVMIFLSPLQQQPVTWLIHMSGITQLICVARHHYVGDVTLSCVGHVWAMTHSYVWHHSINMCSKTPLCVGHDSFMCGPCVGHDSFTRRPPVPWLIHMCDMTHSYVWGDSVMCGDDSFTLWLIGKTDACVQHDSTHSPLNLSKIPCQRHKSCHLFMCGAWLLHV